MKKDRHDPFESDRDWRQFWRGFWWTWIVLGLIAILGIVALAALLSWVLP